MSPIGIISSPENDRVKYAKALKKKRVRYQEKKYLIEGLRLVDQVLESGTRPAFVLYAEDWAASRDGERLVARLAQMGIPAWAVAPALMADVSDTVTPQGIAAVVPMPEPDLDRARVADPLLVLDNLRDPGNMGTILRAALATGVQAVLLSKGCVDPYAPKVVRAGMGAHFCLPIYPSLEWSLVETLCAGKRRILADPRDSVPPWELDLRGPTALIIGNEAHGASLPARALAQSSVSLPMRNGVESLNAAIAASVILFEVQRQRA